MIRNRNGYWMYHKFLSPDDGGGAGGTDTGFAVGIDAGASGTDNAGEGGEEAGQGDQNSGNDNSTDVESLKATIARLEAEAAKNKSALDKATKEAGDARKALKAKMTQEEIEAAAKQEAADKTAKELEDLRREVAKGKTVKNVMGKLGLDEESAGNLADYLYGAADVENTLLEIQKAWQVKEAALRKEFGKVTAPGAGSDSNSPEAIAIRKAQELGKARNALNEQAQKALGAYLR